MKNLKLTLLVLTSVFALTFTSCKKQDLQPDVTSDAKPAPGGGGGGTTPPPAFILSLPTSGIACESDITSLSQYCFTTTIINANNLTTSPGGNNEIHATILDGSNSPVGATQDVYDNTANFCFTGLAAGSYTVRVNFQHTTAGNSVPTQGTFTYPLTVQLAADCGNTCPYNGLGWTRNNATITTDATLNVLNVSVDYVASNCGSTAVNGLKLQGGLVNKAILVTETKSGTGVIVKDNSKTNTGGGNYILSWIFDLPAGTSETFHVEYNVWGTACNNPLTGEWSLKYSNGNTVGPTVTDPITGITTVQPGYLGRLFYGCQ